MCKRSFCNNEIVINKKQKLYCSSKCQRSELVKRYRKRNPRNKIRKNKYRNVKAYREIILSVFNNKCKICFNSTELEIHHIKSRASGGLNDISNIEILCKNCHLKHHKERI